MGKGSPSPPPQPNYEAAAIATAAGDKEAALTAGRLNNPNVINPYGTQTVEYGGAEGDQPTITQTLSPDQQQLLDQQTANQLQLGDLASQGTTAAQGVVGTPLDFSDQPTLPSNGEAYREDVYNAYLSRPLEDLANKRETTKANLIAGGHQLGNEAFDDEMNLLNRQETDTRLQGQLVAGSETSRQYGIDEALRRQGISEQIAQRTLPLNEITALMSGSQVSNPFTVPGYQGGTQLQGPDLIGATTAAGNYAGDVYNAKTAASASNTAGLYGLGGAAIGAAAIAI